MDKINKQILKNQSTILMTLSEMDGTWNVETLNSVRERMKETRDVLEPKETKTLPERTHDVLKEEGDSK